MGLQRCGLTDAWFAEQYQTSMRREFFDHDGVGADSEERVVGEVLQPPFGADGVDRPCGYPEPIYGPSGCVRLKRHKGHPRRSEYRCLPAHCKTGVPPEVFR